MLDFWGVTVWITIVGKSPRSSGQHQPRPQSQSFTLWHFWDPIGGCRFEWSEKLRAKRWFYSQPPGTGKTDMAHCNRRPLRMRSTHLFHGGHRVQLQKHRSHAPYLGDLVHHHGYEPRIQVLGWSSKYLPPGFHQHILGNDFIAVSSSVKLEWPPAL